MDLTDQVSQTYRDTSLFVSRGFSGPESDGAGGALVDQGVGAGSADGFRLAGDDGADGSVPCPVETIEGATGKPRQAVALGRLAHCLERAGEDSAALELRSEQRELHRRFGSILFPASYYAGDRAEPALRPVGAGEAVENCVEAVGDATDPLLCPSCRRPVALTNRCDLTVQLAYCIRLPADDRSVRGCLQFRSLGPGAAMVVLAEAGMVVSPLLSFRSTGARDRWVRLTDKE